MYNQTFYCSIDWNSMKYIMYIHCKYRAIKCVTPYIQVTLHYKNIISIISTVFIRSGLTKNKKSTLFNFMFVFTEKTP